MEDKFTVFPLEARLSPRNGRPTGLEASSYLDTWILHSGKLIYNRVAHLKLEISGSDVRP